ncbi:hypothetical protein ES703_89760 [subsurface metagenome]
MRLGVCGHLSMFFKKMGLKSFKEFMVEGVLGLDRFNENILVSGLLDLFGNNEVISQSDVTLGFFGVGAEAELFDLLYSQTAHSEDVKIENSMLRNRMVAHLKNDGLVGPPGFLHLFSGHSPELIHRTGIPGYPGIGGRQRFRSDILSMRGFFLEVIDDLLVHIVTGEDDFHGFQ